MCIYSFEAINVMPEMIKSEPDKCQIETVSCKRKKPIKVVPMTKEPAAIGKAKDKGNNLRMPIHIKAPSPYRVNPAKNDGVFQLSAAFIRKSPEQLVKT
jgi:hypothetical protein